MAIKNKALHILIHTKFTSEAECARELKKNFPTHCWSKSKLNKYSNGKMPGVVEVNDLSIVLEKSVEELINIFLPEQSPKGDAAA